MKTINTKTSNKTILAFLTGALAAILLTPRSGHATREWVRNRAEHLKSRNKKLSRRIRSQLNYRAGAIEGLNHKIKDIINPTENLLEFDDSVVEDKVRTLIGESPQTSDLAHINVNCEEGIVILRGSVHSFRQKERLEKVVRKVSGVKDIVNKTKIAA